MKCWKAEGIANSICNANCITLKEQYRFIFSYILFMPEFHVWCFVFFLDYAVKKSFLNGYAVLTHL